MLHVVSDAVVRDDKYIVFKRDEFAQAVSHPHLPTEVVDAVVIRTQDAFAGPALHGYAAAMTIAIRILRDTGMVNQAKRLQDIADYFATRAVEADEGPRKIPD